MKLGYARVSTKDQDLSLQLDALSDAGCETIFQEKITATKKERHELMRMLDQLRKNDIVVIWKLDRLGRSLKDLVAIVNQIEEKGAQLQSLNDSLDTSTAHGKLIFHLFASLAEFEREIISERTKAGLNAARARGRKGGRPKGLSKSAEHKAIIAADLYRKQDLSVSEICEQLSISKSTLYRYLRHQGAEISSYKGAAT